MSVQDFEESRRSIEANFAAFQNVVELANDFLDRDKHDVAAVYAQMAADYAMMNHTGLFASSRLEQILFAIGHDIENTGSATQRNALRGGMPRHVLHVLTQAFHVGGHTRLAWRYIRQDAERSHSVALTTQGPLEVPQSLREAVYAAQGEVSILDEKAGDLLSRAKALRILATSADIVVLHVHPYDVVPIIALANKQDCPPVIFVNHADHRFWLGVSVSDVVASLRESGLQLTRERRRVEKERCGLLPIPLDPTRRTLSRPQAKEELGFSKDTVVILSVASAYKYRPISELSFLGALTPVLEKHENAVLLILGPKNRGEWKEAFHKTRGRVKALGVREDTSTFYQAADIYVDSFPFASLTSALEAGSYGIPLVSYCPYPKAAQVLCFDDPGVGDKLLRAASLEDYRAVISRLLEDEEFRAHLGKRTKKGIFNTHVGESWVRSLRDLYRQSATVAPVETTQDRKDRKSFTELDSLVARVFVKEGAARRLDGWQQRNIGLLPLGLRFKLWVRICKANRVLLPHRLLSESTKTRIKKALGLVR